MKSSTHYLLFTLTLAAFHSVQAGPNSMVRVMCDGDDHGAEVSINSKFKGECPIDIQVAPGTLKLRAYKKVDAQNERIFEQEIRIGEGVVKKIEAVLVNRLTEEGKRLEPERLRLAAKAGAEKQESELREFRRSNGFVVHEDVIQDIRTGLMWARKVSRSRYDWKNANLLVKQLDLGGYRDWRLPTKNELVALKRGMSTLEWFESMGFIGVDVLDYWTSTPTRLKYTPDKSSHSSGCIVGRYTCEEDGDDGPAGSGASDDTDRVTVLPVRNSR